MANTKRDAFMELQRHAEERRRGAIVRESLLVSAGAPVDSLGTPAPWSQQWGDVDCDCVPPRHLDDGMLGKPSGFAT
jgi:hypothetical protein